MDFVRGIVKSRFYLAASGVAPNGHPTVWFLAAAPTTNQVYLSSRSEEKARALQFSRVSTAGGHLLSCYQGTTLYYLGIIQSKQGFGPTTLGLVSRDVALVFTFNRPFNLDDLLSGAGYTLKIEQNLETILGTMDTDTQSIGYYYSSSTNGVYSTGVVSLGGMLFYDNLTFYPIPVRVYPTPSDGLSCLFLYLSGTTIHVYTTNEDATVDRFYEYCTGSNTCGTCYGVCTNNLKCVNTTDSLSCGTPAIPNIPVKTFQLTTSMIVMVITGIVVIISIILLASLGHKDDRTELVRIPRA